NELVDLKSQPHIQIVSQNPLGQVSRIDQAVLHTTAAGRILPECRREDAGGTLAGGDLQNEVASEFIVSPAGDYELQLVALGKCAEISRQEGSTLARVRTLHIDNLYHLLRYVR